VDVCLYFLAAHRLKWIDIKFMQVGREGGREKGRAGREGSESQILVGPPLFGTSHHLLPCLRFLRALSFPLSRVKLIFPFPLSPPLPPLPPFSLPPSHPQAISAKIALIPLLAKADSMTAEETLAFRSFVFEACQHHAIRLFDFGSEAKRRVGIPTDLVAPPFAVVASNQFDEVSTFFSPSHPSLDSFCPLSLPSPWVLFPAALPPVP